MRLYFGGDLLFGEGVKDKQRVLDALNSGKHMYNVYLILLLPGTGNLFEIMHSKEAFKTFNVNRVYVPVAVSFGKAEAEAIVVGLFTGYLQTSQGFNRDDFVQYVMGLKGTGLS